MELDEEIIFLINAYRALKTSTAKPVPTNKMRQISGGKAKAIDQDEINDKFIARVTQLVKEDQVTKEAATIVYQIYDVKPKKPKIERVTLKPFEGSGFSTPRFVPIVPVSDGCSSGSRRSSSGC